MKSIVFLVFFLGFILISSTITGSSFADVIRPKQQIKLNFTAEQVICSEDLVKIIKKSSGNAACVKPTSAEKLAQNGWAKELSEQEIEEINQQSQEKGTPAGTITKIATVKQLTQEIKAGTAGILGYVYVFDACATSNAIRTPEILVTSDSEIKHVKLASMLQVNSCYTSSAIIKAADPNSISATLLNKGGISENISSLESQIADLKDKISTAKQTLPKSADQTPKKESIDSITSMKKDLTNLQDQLRRYLLALYVPPNVKVSDIEIPKSITGKPLEGISTELISVTEGVVKPDSDNPDLKRFNVIFEACTGKSTVRLPIITINSDSESVEIKLIDRIIPNSCQVGIGKINALDSESITAKISNDSGVSIQIAELEKQIDDLQIMLGEKRQSLKQLFSKKLDTSGEELAAQIALDISQLRTDILEKRAKLYGLMLGI